MPAIQVFYSPDYVMSEYAFDTTRKAQWIAESLESTPIPGIELVAPAPLKRADILAVHSPEYARAVETGEPRSLAESQGFEWDAGLYPMALASCGGMVTAARTALEQGVSGSLSSGFHHAGYGSGNGFCTFNGLILAAKAAQAVGAERILILDLDAHCGGGTASLIEDEPGIWQFGVAVWNYDNYYETERARLRVIRDSSQYLPTIRQVLQEIERLEPFHLCLYNAGMDPCESAWYSPGAPSGGSAGITSEVLAEREKLVFGWCTERQLPVAFALAGGYVGSQLDQQGLVALHRLTLESAATNK
ncbi:MAG: hypothetical protein QM758_17915 [Armatimonas sp.]